jgi:hypothetical protein
MQIYNLTKSTHFFWSGRNVFEAVDRSLPATFVSVATGIVTPAKYMEPEKIKVRGESGSPKISYFVQPHSN